MEKDRASISCVVLWARIMLRHRSLTFACSLADQPERESAANGESQTIGDEVV